MKVSARRLLQMWLDTAKSLPTSYEQETFLTVLFVSFLYININLNNKLSAYIHVATIYQTQSSLDIINARRFP